MHMIATISNSRKLRKSISEDRIEINPSDVLIRADLYHVYLPSIIHNMSARITST